MCAPALSTRKTQMGTPLLYREARHAFHGVDAVAHFRLAVADGVRLSLLPRKLYKLSRAAWPFNTKQYLALIL